MNGMLLIDKPEGWTSHDVVAKLRGILKERRIGHSGTLDPMATGLLVAFLGRATRAVQFAESHSKEYIAGLRTGVVTDTQDITGTILERSDKSVELSELIDVLPEFTGEIMQIPPMYSAIKVEGKKLYDLARRGIEVERKPRPITIHAITAQEQSKGDFLLQVSCSKGTYIRTLCHDIGQRLETGAAMSSLRRVRAGNFSVDEALTLDEVSELSAQGQILSRILPVDSLFMDKPAVKLNEWEKGRCLCGNSFSFSASDGEYRVYGSQGEFLMLGRVSSGIMTTVKSFFEVN